jgi:transposase-like protein
MTSLFGTSGMPPKKLSDSDKQEILDRYCHSDETTVTLAAQYGVSTSTVSRILKQSLPEDEYEALVQRKRQGGRSQPDQAMLPGMLPVITDAPAVEPLLEEDASPASEWSAAPPMPQRRQRKRSAAGSISVEQLAASAAHLSQLDLAPAIKQLDDLPPVLERETREFTPPILKTEVVVDEFAPLPEEEDLEDDLDDDDLPDLDEDDLEDEFDETGFADEFVSLDPMPNVGLVQILPLTEAPIPRTCYVVVDRASELITRPLKDFADLGDLPIDETQDKTLPIFDNHRVAKRFLRRMQRIVKVPDGRVFQKVRPYLQAKGITHLLIDGQVYSLQ